jgi:hypothetical protein
LTADQVTEKGLNPYDQLTARAMRFKFTSIHSAEAHKIGAGLALNHEAGKDQQ